MVETQDNPKRAQLKAVIMQSKNKTWLRMMKGLHRDCQEMSEVIDKRIEELNSPADASGHGTEGT